MYFQREDLRSLLSEGGDLIAAHALESSDQRDRVVDLNAEQYENLEKNGMIVFFVARTDDHEMIGYSVFVISTNMHHKNVMQAYQDALYLSDKGRGHGNKFIDYTVKELANLGVEAVYIPAKTKNSLGKLLERKGFEKTEEIFLRRL